jgi:hypothetical protein
MKQTANKISDQEFHAVDFMRRAREQLSAQNQADKQKYLERARAAMESFKLLKYNTSR